MHSHPRVVAVLGPDPGGALQRAVTSGGARVTPDDVPAGLIWTGDDVEVLRDSVARSSDVEWVQLPSAGVEEYETLMHQHPDIKWTCAKGIYGAAVAEQAVAMLLALRRGLPTHAAAREWSTTVPSRPLVGSGAVVTLLGGGGIALHTAAFLGSPAVSVGVITRPDGRGAVGSSRRG